jgi:hypothetical protein
VKKLVTFLPVLDWQDYAKGEGFNTGKYEKK